MEEWDEIKRERENEEYPSWEKKPGRGYGPRFKS